MMATSSFAQSSDKQLQFMDIPIGGTLNDFVEKLDKAGYSIKEKNDTSAFLIGNFACYRKCDITILKSKTNDWVKKVGVCLPVSKKWEMLLSNYFVLKNTLTRDYGYPTDGQETFINGQQPADDKEKMEMLDNGKCFYESIFRAQDGEITLTITRNNNVLLMFTSDFY